MPHDVSLLEGIALSIVVAAGFALAARVLKQPVVLAYIAAGAVIGPGVGFHLIEEAESIEAISEIGLILMLFMIGLHMDLKLLAKAGSRVVVTGIIQFGAGVAIAFGFFALLGFTLGDGRFDLLYLAVATSLSSTMIVVKLLYDKQELDTLAGRITLGILVLQDIWAITMMAILPNLENPDVGVLILSLVKGVGMVVGALLASRYLLPHIFKFIAKEQELMLLASIAWCFLIAGLSGWLELSRPMGALIAGVSISTFPYNREVVAKVISIRDFFITLFFVALGMRIPEPTGHMLLMAAAASAFVIISRFLTIYPVLYLLKSGNRVSFLPSLNLAQASEFGLVIGALGISLGHIGDEVIGILVFALAITATISTYMINYSNSVYLFAERVLKKVGLRDLGHDDVGHEGESHGIVFLGFFRVASSLLAELENHDPKLLKDVLVIDYNPDVRRRLTQRGIHCVYGDISNTTTLAESEIGDASIVVSTVPDSLLKGINNLGLIRPLRALCPDAKICVTAETISSAIAMYEAGADLVFLPRIDAAAALAPLFLNLDAEPQSFRERHIEELRSRNEVVG